MDDQEDVQGRRDDGNRQKQCQDVCREADRCDVQGCGRTGRGEGIPAGGGGFPA